MKHLIKWLGYPFVALSRIYKERGMLYTIYFLLLGFTIGLVVRLWNDVKHLGWLLGTIAFIVSALLFFLPTIVGGTIYAINGSTWWLSVATAYFMWVVYPTGSSLWFAAITASVIELIKILKH